uniref:Uncharacterized protein n=1 Tax=Varanus komodoensis TaxID=61221 RepID=A0A8D2KTZ4_VARKO
MLLALLATGMQALRGQHSSPSQPLWFDYPDSDKEKILATYKLIGEQPEFIAPSTFPGLLRSILLGSVVLILLFFLYQIISKMYVSPWPACLVCS